MAYHTRNESDSLLHTSDAPDRIQLVDTGENTLHQGLPATTTAASSSFHDAVESDDHNVVRPSSVEANDTPGTSAPQSVYAAESYNNASTLQGGRQDDSTVQLTSQAAQAGSSPVKPVQVSTNELTRPHRGGRGGHGSRKHPPRKRKGPRSPKDNIIAWKFELIAAFLAIAILVTEIILLVHYNGKFLFLHWPHDWKINAVFAFLTTFLEAAIAFYVGACIGQLKWSWFKKKQHRLEWLEIMTEARQPPGAMRLLFKKGMWRQFAAFGALIVILLLGVSTFTQNVITEDIAPFFLSPTGGSVPINTNYFWRETETTIRLGTQQPVPEMVAAIQNGFYSFSTRQKTIGAAAWTSCWGDTCDFGKYQSIAVCSKCADISNEVVNPCPTGNCLNTDYYTLKNGIDLSLLTTNGALNLSADTKFTTDPGLSSEVGPLIVRFHAMVANEVGLNRTGTGASATECAAWWCVKTYSGKVTNATLHEDVLEAWTNKSVNARTTYLQEENISLHPPQCFVNNTTPDNPKFCTFTAGPYSQNALQNFLAVPVPSTPFEPFLRGSAVYLRTRYGEATWNYTSLLAGGLVGASSAKAVVLDEIQTGFHKMAEQMTVSIRGERPSGGGAAFSFGSATYREPIFHVRWGWLAYPVALVVISLFFLVVTIFKTRNQEVWKTSILPMIFHAFGGTDREQFVQLDTVEEMKAVSRGQRMYLDDDAGGHAMFKAGSVAPEHGRRHEMSQSAASGVGHIMEAVGQAV